MSMAAGGPEALQFSFKELLAGGAAGFFEHFLMFPFDTIKTRMQSGSSARISDVLRVVRNEERLTHLYRGCVPVLVSSIPAHGAYFSVYEAFKRLLGDETNIGIATSACFATVAHDVVSTPFDVVKQRMQMDANRTFSSSIACGSHILKKEGVRALYSSLPTTIAMNLPHFATYWLTYEGLITTLHGEAKRHRENEMTVDYMFSGFMAGAAASVVSFPLDTVKTQLQLGRGHTFSQALKSLIAERGIRGMFTGVLPRVLYTAPSGAIMMVTYETAKNLLSIDKGL